MVSCLPGFIPQNQVDALVSSFGNIYSQTRKLYYEIGSK